MEISWWSEVVCLFVCFVCCFVLFVFLCLCVIVIVIVSLYINAPDSSPVKCLDAHPAKQVGGTSGVCVQKETDVCLLVYLMGSDDLHSQAECHIYFGGQSKMTLRQSVESHLRQSQSLRLGARRSRYQVSIQKLPGSIGSRLHCLGGALASLGIPYTTRSMTSTNSWVASGLNLEQLLQGVDSRVDGLTALRAAGAACKSLNWSTF